MATKQVCGLALDSLKQLSPGFGEVQTGYYQPQRRTFWLEGFTPINGTIEGRQVDISINWTAQLKYGAPIEDIAITPTHASIHAYNDDDDCTTEMGPRQAYEVFGLQVTQWWDTAVQDILAPSSLSFERPEDWPTTP